MKIWTVDAFTSSRFSGNPAAVTLVDVFPPDRFMQELACEMNLSETAFVQPIGEGRYHIRWFTPTTEVDLCGHATLAAGHILKEEAGIDADEITFESRSGQLKVVYKENKVGLEFPLFKIEKCQVNTDILEALGAETCEEMAAVNVSQNKGYLIVCFSTQEDLETLHPDYYQISKLTDRGVIVTAPGRLSFDYVLRLFAPQMGINEDPVTGSAQCALAEFWQQRLGKRSFKVKQLSKRQGELLVTHKEDKVEIWGDAVVVSELTLRDS